MIIDKTNIDNYKNLKILNDPDISGISYRIFYKNQNIEKIKLDNLEILENSAFEGCSNLKSVEISPLVSELHANVFANCKNLETINTDYIKIIHGFALEQTNIKKLNLENVIKIDDYAFLDSNIESAYLPNIHFIDGTSFENCGNLKTVEIHGAEGYNVELYGYTFKNCTSLETVKLSNITAIGGNIFEGCTNLKTVIIDKGLVNIRPGCKFPDWVNVIYNGTTKDFEKVNNYSKFKNIIIKDSLDEMLNLGMSIREINDIKKSCEMEI